MTGAPASEPMLTPAERPSDSGIVTGKSPLPTGAPSRSKVIEPGTPLPFAMSALPVGLNSKLKSRL
ncbi:MAG: hypothetical protein WB715_20285 [Roseiarcus sp.]|uniref:hypothetical protein n=1 Tax=Roseiarcus sp. TaxID=1969460 RepID=UPI003C65CC4C